MTIRMISNELDKCLDKETPFLYKFEINESYNYSDNKVYHFTQSELSVILFNVNILC